MAALSSEIALGDLEEGDTFVFANQLCTRGKELRVLGNGKGNKPVHYRAVEYNYFESKKKHTLPALARVVPIY